jgi:hypothetical protein
MRVEPRRGNLPADRDRHGPPPLPQQLVSSQSDGQTGRTRPNSPGGSVEESQRVLGRALAGAGASHARVDRRHQPLELAKAQSDPRQDEQTPALEHQAAVDGREA